jgi:K+-sensing histidine kinase KdpD
LDSEQKSYTEKIIQNNNEMLEIINKYLEFSEMGSIKLSITKKEESICSVIDEVIKSYEIICANRSIKVEKHCSDDIPNFQFDKNRILEVTINIIERAIKNTPDNSTIKIEIKKADDKVIVDISDSGIDIPEEEIPKIFYPFYMMMSNNKEVGDENFSMAISKLIIEAHDGEIAIENKKGAGNIYKYKLPVINF